MTGPRQTGRDRVILSTATTATRRYLQAFLGSDTEMLLWASHPELSEADARQTALVAAQMLASLGGQLGSVAKRALTTIKEADVA